MEIPRVTKYLMQVSPSTSRTLYLSLRSDPPPPSLFLSLSLSLSSIPPPPTRLLNS